MQNCSDQADGWFPGTSDIDKEVLPKKFFQTMRKQPPQLQFTFRTLLSKSEKKILHVCKKKSFFCRNELHLVRGFQKGMALGVK